MARINWNKVKDALKKVFEMLRPDHPREVEELKRNAELLYRKLKEKVAKGDAEADKTGDGDEAAPEPQQDPYIGP